MQIYACNRINLVYVKLCSKNCRKKPKVYKTDIMYVI